MEDCITEKPCSAKIKLIKAPSTENFVCRMVTEDNKIEMGVYPVIYGFRVRAGYVGRLCCEIDWCCGSDKAMLEFAYSVCKKLIENGVAFKDMLPQSKIKPFYNDHDFTAWLTSHAKSDLVIEKLPALHEMKEEFFKNYLLA